MVEIQANRKAWGTRLAEPLMGLVITTALEFFNRQLLCELSKLCIELGEADTQLKANDQQNKDEEQEYEVRRRHSANEIRKPKEDLRKDARKQQERREAKPKQ